MKKLSLRQITALSYLGSCVCCTFVLVCNLFAFASVGPLPLEALLYLLLLGASIAFPALALTLLFILISKIIRSALSKQFSSLDYLLKGPCGFAICYPISTALVSVVCAYVMECIMPLDSTDSGNNSWWYIAIPFALLGILSGCFGSILHLNLIREWRKVQQQEA